MQETILQFSDVSISDAQDYDAGVQSVTCSIGAGDMMLVRAEKQYRKLPICDAAQGLIGVDAGTIQFRQRTWETMSPDEAARCRGSFGRVFETWGWVSNLDLDENITLKERHWKNRSKADVDEEALAIARQFGIEELPRKRPAWVSRSVRQRAQWVRALLGSPDILLFAYPEQYVEHEHVEQLIRIVHRRLEDGCAVMWFTLDAGVWETPGLKSKLRYRMQGSSLIKEPEA